MRQQTCRSVLPAAAILLLIILSSASTSAAADKKTSKADSTAMTEAELQAQVMAFADRFTSIVTSGITAYNEQNPPPDDYRLVLSLASYSLSSAFTIAAEPSPVGALLDMITMVTLGRIIFEENLLPRYGPALQSVIDVMRKAEAEIWLVASDVLTEAQLKKLRSLIVEWRARNPEIEFFPSIRFSDFSAMRGSEAGEVAGGLFKSVNAATQQVEEVRLLAERGMYLGTRMPMLTGLFAGVFFSQMIRHPDARKIIDDFNRFLQVSDRLAAVAEQLPEQIAAERDATIKQAMEGFSQLTMNAFNETEKKTLVMIDAAADRITAERQAAIEQLMKEFAAERKRTIDDLLDEDQRMRVLLADMRQTLVVGNDLLTTAKALTDNLKPPGEEIEGKAVVAPVDIDDYHTLLQEASTLIGQLHDTLKTVDHMGIQSLLPAIIGAIETVEQKGERWVYLSFTLGVALIVVFLVGAVIASLVYRHIANRMFPSASMQAEA